MIDKGTINSWYDKGQKKTPKMKINYQEKQRKTTSEFNEDFLEAGWRELQGLLSKF